MLRTTAVWTGVAGTPWYTSMYWEGTGSVDAQSVVTKVASWLNEITSLQVTALSAQVDPFVADVSVATGEATGGYITTPPAPSSGDTTGQMLPGGVCAQFNWRTGSYVGGRAIVGKTFMGGFSASASTITGGVDPAFRTSFNSANAALIGGAQQMLIYSRKNRRSFTVGAADLSTKFALVRSRRD